MSEDTQNEAYEGGNYLDTLGEMGDVTFNRPALPAGTIVPLQLNSVRAIQDDQKRDILITRFSVVDGDYEGYTFITRSYMTPPKPGKKSGGFDMTKQFLLGLAVAVLGQEQAKNGFFNTIEPPVTGEKIAELVSTLANHTFVAELGKEEQEGFAPKQTIRGFEPAQEEVAA